MRMHNGLVTFYSQLESQDDQESSDDGLSVGTPVGSAFHDHSDLVLHDDGQRRNSNNQHEGHRYKEHLVVLACIAKPCCYCNEADGCEQLVSCAEETPDLGKSAHAEHDAENYSEDGCKVGVNHEFLEAALDILRGLAGFQPEFLEHEAGKTGCGIKRGEAECGVGQNQQGVHDIFHAGESRDGCDHGCDAACENIGCAFYMACFSSVGDSAEGDDSEYAFQKHAAVSNRFCILFFIQLFGSGAGGYERMETGNSAASYGGEQDREQVLGACFIGYNEISECREEIRVDVRMSAYNADDSNDEHCIE